MLNQHSKEVNKDLAEADGVLIIDGSDFPKQGRDSVGVKRQYCGELGKVANCQAGVFLAYASRQGYTLLDRRLYLPKEWHEDEAYEGRREACGVPEHLGFKTKAELALDMVKHLHETGSLSYQWLTYDVVLGDYQLRSWIGWHHHMTLVILAHFFLVRLKLRLKDKAPKLSLAQALLLLKASLPQPDFSVEKTIDIVNYYQKRHESAYLSHRKKRLAQLNMLEQ